MSTGIFGSKQTSEQGYYQFDFSHDIASGNTIASTTLVVTDVATGSTCTAAMIDATKENVDGLLVNFWLRGGTSGKYYTIDCTVKTGIAEIYESDGTIYVQDLPVASTITAVAATWAKKQATAERLINKYGADMTLVHITLGAFNATLDEYATSEVSYSARGVLLNPTQMNEAGVYRKSDAVDILLSAKNLPDLKAAEDWKITCGVEEWYPDKIVAIKPGGVSIIYLVYLK